MSQRSPITCHILDLTVGKPAEGVLCAIYKLPDASASGDGADPALEVKFGLASTNSDGRVVQWHLDPSFTAGNAGPEGVWDLQKGFYKIRFQTSRYFKGLPAAASNRTFFPYVDIVFEVDNPAEHYHVPLLLANHGYSTYRGS